MCAAQPSEVSILPGARQRAATGCIASITKKRDVSHVQDEVQRDADKDVVVTYRGFRRDDPTPKLARCSRLDGETCMRATLAFEPLHKLHCKGVASSSSWTPAEGKDCSCDSQRQPHEIAASSFARKI